MVWMILNNLDMEKGQLPLAIRSTSWHSLIRRLFVKSYHIWWRSVISTFWLLRLFNVMTIAVRSPFLEFGCILPPTEGELYELVLQSKIILDILRHIGLLEAKRGKYSTRALWQYRFLSLGRLHVPREVDLADKTRVAVLPSSCPPG